MTATQPSQEECNVILGGLSAAQTRLAQLQGAKALDDTRFEHGNYKGSLLGFLQRGKTAQAAPSGARLATEIAAAELHLQVTTRLFDEWNARNDAWIEEHRTAPAADPTP